MATSLLALLDDIATVLDDVSIMTKVAAKRTAGVLGDDLALNAEQVSGVRADRELPVVWAVFKGSALNKCIIVPVALALSVFAPILITPLLMIGGAFLCYEGFEKIAHKLLHPGEKETEDAALRDALHDPGSDLVEFEKNKIKGAIRTDFILSMEIIVISLSAVQESSFTTQVGTLIAIAVLMTLGVYGLVAGIVKLDDLGQHLVDRSGGTGISGAAGNGILSFAPYLMKGLSIVGTAAMFLVGGGILVHGIPMAESLIGSLLQDVTGIVHTLAEQVLIAILGIIAGGILVPVAMGVGKLAGMFRR